MLTGASLLSFGMFPDMSATKTAVHFFIHKLMVGIFCIIFPANKVIQCCIFAEDIFFLCSYLNCVIWNNIPFEWYFIFSASQPYLYEYRERKNHTFLAFLIWTLLHFVKSAWNYLAWYVHNLKPYCPVLPKFRLICAEQELVLLRGVDPEQRES